jgi:hypothetical protein
MEKLHEILATTLRKAIENDCTDGDGKPVAVSASILNVARQFLKDNGIEAAAIPNSATGRLAQVFPFKAESDELDLPDTIINGVTK